ncbi:MAG TPA: ribosomal-protein-alanine N-acetyltransferase RimI [Armatimonadetes bacterium]|nr:ribosomal-protein-alanine N-acetyltransferase RimI [Armatimonadota bacterium]
MSAVSAVPPAPRQVGWLDLAAVIRLNRLCFPDPYSVSRFAGFLLTPRCYILAVGPASDLRGYVVVSHQTYPAPPRLVAEVTSIATHPDARRQGVARLLLNEVCQREAAVGIGQLYLQVAVSNLAAQTLYASLGFVRDRRLPKYYQSGEDAWLMVRALEPETRPD